MKNFRFVVAALSLSLCASGFVAAAQDDAGAAAKAQPAASDEKAAPAAAPAADAAPAGEAEPEKKAAKGKGRLVKPWRDLSSLTDDQKARIIEIHKKGVAERKASESRERAEIEALLGPEQKAELQALMDKKTAEQKAKKPAGGKKERAAQGDAENAG